MSLLEEIRRYMARVVVNRRGTTDQEWWRFLVKAHRELCYADMEETFVGTHIHMGNGFPYQILHYGKIKADGAQWESAVFYRGSDGSMYATSLLRWNARFQPIEEEAKV